MMTGSYTNDVVDVFNLFSMILGELIGFIWFHLIHRFTASWSE